MKYIHFQFQALQFFWNDSTKKINKIVWPHSQVKYPLSREMLLLLNKDGTRLLQEEDAETDSYD